MKTFIFAALVFVVPTTAFADNAETQMNEAGIDAVEKHWGDAFTGGDGAYLGMLLDDDYISVSGKGVARTKADIIALAQQIAAKSKATPPAPASSAPAQKSVSKTTIRGTTAIVTSTGFGQMSVDVFHYENGAWHAWYSQHTMIAPADMKS